MKQSFAVHDLASAPHASRAHLEQARKAFGRIPNLIGTMAESPAVLGGYLGIAAAFAQSSFTPLEQHVVLQTVNAVNGCHYCTAAHSAAAILGLKVDPALDAALRAQRPLADARLEALRSFAAKVASGRGWVPDADLQAFLDAGFTKAQVLEVVLGVGQKTISNYINHIVGTPVDAPFLAFAVEKAA